MPLLLFRDAAQNVDSVVCIHVKRHQSAGRWIIFGGICTFCSMLMSKAAKARLPGERRGDGGSKKREGAAWKRGKQTEAGVNYGCNLQFPRGKERQRETSSHAYQIEHLPHFLIMVHEQTHIQSGPCVHVCACVWDREWARAHLHIHPCQVAWSCEVPSSFPWALIWHVCFRLCGLSLHRRVAPLCTVWPSVRLQSHGPWCSAHIVSALYMHMDTQAWLFCEETSRKSCDSNKNGYRFMYQGIPGPDTWRWATCFWTPRHT